MTFLARCVACGRYYHEPRHLAKHNRTFAGHQVLVLLADEYDRTTGFKKTNEDYKIMVWKSRGDWF